MERPVRRQRELLHEQSDRRHFRRGYRTYVCSFCGAAEAVHWLHYGRSGTRVAIGFDSIALLSINQFTLYPVIYDIEEQDALLLAVIRLVDDYAGRFSSLGDIVDPFFGELPVSYLRFAAPRMKDPAFKSENEWRLVSNEVWAEKAEDPTRTTFFRSPNGRVVP